MAGSSCHLGNFFDRIVEGYQKQKRSMPTLHQI